jgi:hypothetical protein
MVCGRVRNMERMVLVVHCDSDDEVDSLQKRINILVSNQGERGWTVASATTSVSTCSSLVWDHTEWVTTLVFEREKK